MVNPADITARVRPWFADLRPLLLSGWRQAVANEQKADGTPVTAVDKAVEKALRARITAAFPDHGIDGEEFGLSNGASPWRWYLDPLDGTKAYLSGSPLFGTLLGLWHGDTPVWGACYLPVPDELYIGHAGGAWCNETPLRAASLSVLEDAILAATAPEIFNAAEGVRFQQLQQHVRFTRWGGDCSTYTDLAAGRVHVVMEAGLKPQDILPLVPLLTAAGATITDWNGQWLRPGKDTYSTLTSSSKNIHKEALKIIY
ncbi:MAG: inositol monophosphatase family protein [Holosporales bacterium]